MSPTKKERLLNVGGINADSKVLQGIIDFLASGQIVITSVNTDDARSVTFTLADPLDVNLVSPDPVNVAITEPLDDTSGVLTTISYAHHEIHEGDSYICDNLQTDSFDLAFYVPAGTKRVHFNWSWAAESKAEVLLLEGPTWDTGTGSQVTIFNRNRNSTNESIVQEDTGGSFAASMNVVLDPDNPAGGTEVHHFETWSDKKQTVIIREEREVILKNDKLYILRFTSNDGIKGSHLIMNWYEED